MLNALKESTSWVGFDSYHHYYPMKIRCLVKNDFKSSTLNVVNMLQVIKPFCVSLQTLLSRTVADELIPATLGKCDVIMSLWLDDHYIIDIDACVKEKYIQGIRSGNKLEISNFLLN